MLTTEIAGDQIDGAREYQEDAFLITRLGDTATLAIVADGMGGHAAGNVASNMAIQSFNKFLTSRFPFTEPAEVLRQAVLEANQSIADTIHETPALKGMGCTLVCAVIDEARLHWVSVGDSHLYVCRDGTLEKLNADHSYGGFLAALQAEGRAAPNQTGFSANMLMSAVAGGEINAIDCPSTPYTLRAGDRLLIASDGVDSLPLPTLTELMARDKSPRETVATLLAEVAAAAVPRQDNTTVIALKVLEKAGPAPIPDFSAERMARLKEGRPLPPREAPLPVVDAPPRTRRRIPLVLLGLVVLAVLGMWLNPTQRTQPIESPTTPAVTSRLDFPESPVAQTTPAPAPAKEADSIAPAEVSTPFVDGPGPAMIAVPGGRFLMGSPDSSPHFDERPQHPVTLRPFSISVHEITRAEFARFSGRGTGNLPASRLSWRDARAYTRWLSQRTGHRYRLPTEAEWEYAARAGGDSHYPWGSRFAQGKAHCIACGTAFNPRAPAPVGQFPANAFGLHDMAGNLAEWVADCHAEDYRAAAKDGRAFEASGCSRRVVRGGSFASAPEALRVTARDALGETSANDSVGFRVVRED